MSTVFLAESQPLSVDACSVLYTLGRCEQQPLRMTSAPKVLLHLAASREVHQMGGLGVQPSAWASHMLRSWHQVKSSNQKGNAARRSEVVA